MNKGLRDRLRLHIPAHDAEHAQSRVIADAAGMDRSRAASFLSEMAHDGWVDRIVAGSVRLYRRLSPDAEAERIKAGVDQRNSAIAKTPKPKQHRQKAPNVKQPPSFQRMALNPAAPVVNPGVKPTWCGSVPDRFAVAEVPSVFGRIGQYEGGTHLSRVYGGQG